jgi:hypothetical protein
MCPRAGQWQLRLPLIVVVAGFEHRILPDGFSAGCAVQVSQRD